MQKYHNIRTEVDGIVFDSKKESARYSDLKLLLQAGAISDLKLQVSFPLVVNDVKIGVYRCDFAYDENGHRKIEDVKGVKTKEYVIKKKLMLALYGIEIFET